MLIMIDNYDSFTYNLVQYLAGLGADLRVYRNDALSVAEIAAMAPEGIVLSPGPCSPKEAGICVELVRTLSGAFPLLGVCLGHQSIGAAFGADVVRAKRVMHGKTSNVTFGASPLYEGIKSPATVGRYHSLAVAERTLPPELVVDARTEDGEVMGMHHAAHPTYGVQFHPESILTPCGKRLLKNYLAIVARSRGGRRQGEGRD